MKNILVDFYLNGELRNQHASVPDFAIETVEPQECERRIPKELLDNEHFLLCKFPPKNFDDLRCLECIQVSSIGYFQLFDLGRVERRVLATNACKVFDVPITELNIAMMVNLCRDIPGLIRNQENVRWGQQARFEGKVHGLVISFWGYCGAAKETAQIGKTTGVTVYVMTLSGLRARERSSVASRGKKV